MTHTDFNARRYWDRRLKRRWSLHGTGMVKLSHRYNRWLYRVRRVVFRRTVRNIALDVPDSTILDIGSGTGFYIHLWRRLGAQHITGLDIADSAVARLRKKFRKSRDVRFKRVDVSDELPFDDGSFDVVSAFDILFHIVDDDRYRQAIANVHRVLGRHGRFIFTEHVVANKKQGGKHYVSRSRDEIDDLLRREGFELVSRKPAFVLMLPPYSSSSRWRWGVWSKVLVPLMKRERSGQLVGAALFPLELLLTRFRKHSPSMEIVVCRKVPTSAGAR